MVHILSYVYHLSRSLTCFLHFNRCVTRLQHLLLWPKYVFNNLVTASLLRIFFVTWQYVLAKHDLNFKLSTSFFHIFRSEKKTFSLKTKVEPKSGLKRTVYTSAVSGQLFFSPQHSQMCQEWFDSCGSHILSKQKDFQFDRKYCPIHSCIKRSNLFAFT